MYLSLLWGLFDLQTVIINALDIINHLPEIQIFGIDIMECMILVLNWLPQVADRLQTCNLDRKDTASVIAKDPTVELKYIGHDECCLWLSCGQKWIVPNIWYY